MRHHWGPQSWEKARWFDGTCETAQCANCGVIRQKAYSVDGWTTVYLDSDQTKIVSRTRAPLCEGLNREESDNIS
jgi:hypothetical protein